jgi:SAM-dependent methyltransferase
MRLSYHRIAYEALEVCNAVDLATVEATLRPTGLKAGRALDIGCGNAGVSVMLAERFGLAVTAVEYDPAMASLAASRVAASSASAEVTLIEGPSATVLAQGGLWNLIVAMGTTDPVGGGMRDPTTIMTALHERVHPGGWLLWGDLVWLSEPSPPLRQIIELTGIYLDHDGWQAAARAAGFEVASVTLSSQRAWDAYTVAMDTAVRAWLAANPDHPDAASIQARADQLSMMMDFGRGIMGFGLYLLRRPEA